jgi:hypothetical protein
MAIISLNSVNHLIFVMVKCGVLFEVRTELYIIHVRSGAQMIKDLLFIMSNVEQGAEKS